MALQVHGPFKDGISSPTRPCVLNRGRLRDMKRNQGSKQSGLRLVGLGGFARIRACWASFAIGMLVLAPVSGCGGERKPLETPLRIAAASDLTLALPRLIERFEGETHLKATSVLGVSGQLANQIKEGAPYDVFMAADQAYVDGLATSGSIEAVSVHSYARGSLVLAVRSELADQVRSLEDLTGPAVKRIALANPAFAPYGRAGKQALERAGLWPRVEAKVVMGESVRQALIYVERGDAEAALVGLAIARSPSIHAVEIRSDLYDPIIQALGIVARSSQRDEAGRFVAFVLSDTGQAILKDFGFQPAPTRR